MSQASEAVRTFFGDYELGIDGLDLVVLSSAYGDSFMFAGSHGALAVNKGDFLKVLPKRRAFFQSVGLVSSRVVALEETRLDADYIMVNARWSMRFEKDLHRPVVDETTATYVLFQQGNSLRIVFQLDHQDLTKRVQELGLAPADS